MYAKIFKSLFEGSLRGRPDEILVFVNLLTNASGEFCDRHFRAIAEETGLTIEQVRVAIAALESPDPESRSPDEDGRRILRMSEHRDWGWRIVNLEYYRKLKDEEDRREYMRNLMRKRRSTGHSGAKAVGSPLAGVSKCGERLAELGQAEAEAEATCAEAPEITRNCGGQTEKKPRANKVLLEALVSLDGSDPATTTKSAWGRAGKALKDIVAVSPDVTVDLIELQAGRYRQKYPKATLTSSAIATHWSALLAFRAQTIQRRQPNI